MQILIKDHKTDKAKEAALVNEAQNNDAEDNRPSRFEKWLVICCIIGLIVYIFLWFPGLNNCLTGYQYGCRFPTYLDDPEPYLADQVHLSMGSDSSELYVTWMILNRAKVSKLKYSIINEDGTLGPEAVVIGDLTDYTIKGDKKSCPFINSVKPRGKLHTYRAKMSHLIPGKSYKYWIVNEFFPHYVRNSIWHFHKKNTITIKNISDPSQEINLAFYGDLGLINGQSITRLIKDVSNDLYDLVVHNGDFAYDLDTNYGSYGDMFMRLIEPIASKVPYQTSVGNHEVKENFTHYDARFTMINSGGTNNGLMNNFYYSFNVGPIHFVAFSTEFYYFVDYSGISALNAQYEWLKKDLAFASSPEQRKVRPWIVVFGHRPMYCSSRDRDDCTKETNILRKGFAGAYALEKLFYDFGVDVELYSHEHQYERFLPIYNGQVYNGTDDANNPYYNPLAPVHLISGSAGCQERIDFFSHHHQPGSIKKIADYGFTRIKASRCGLSFQQVSDDQDGTVVDHFKIEKTRQNFPTKSDEIYGCDSGEPYIWPAIKP